MLSDLARVAWEGFSDATEAQRYLDEALALVPDHLPAILEIADIYYKEGQWEQAEKRLSEAVRRLRHQPQQAARLFQRLAEVHEKTGKLDEAYRQLLEADKMGPGQLLTKLSLGENRFRAGKWREAALHLGSLAEHPDAALYPDEVADALGHAAQAEIKLRRPERAIELYEAALGLRGGTPRRRCARWPTWRWSAANARRPPATCGACPRSQPIGPSARRRWSSWATFTWRSTTRTRRCGRTTRRARPSAARPKSRSVCWKRRSSCSGRAATSRGLRRPPRR